MNIIDPFGKFASFAKYIPSQKNMQKFLSGLKWYLVFSGIVGFSMFILEESIQTTMFGTWPAKSAKAWASYKRGIDIIISINRTLKIITYTVGWIQPMALISYSAYAEATDMYIEGCMAEIIAFEPELYIDQKVRVTLQPKKIENLEDGRYFVTTSGKVAARVRLRDPPELGHDLHVEGTMRKQGNYLVIE